MRCSSLLIALSHAVIGSQAHDQASAVKYSNKFAAHTLGACGLFLIVFGGWIVTQEGAAYILNGGTAIKTVAAHMGEQSSGLGIASRGELLFSCQTTLRSEKSLELRYMPDTSFNELVALCREVAENIAKASPNFSLAWALAADAAKHQLDWAAMNEFLFASQHSGPNEQWIARYRFQIANDVLASLTPETRKSYDQDMRLMILSNKGTPYMAQQYLLDPSFRERLGAILAEMEEFEQRRFVQTLHSMLVRSPH